MLVKVETDEGITGLGESYRSVGGGELVHRAKPLLIGENPFNIGKLYEVMIRCLSGEGSLTDAPGHGLTLNEDVARAHLKPGSSFFGELPWA